MGLDWLCCLDNICLADLLSFPGISISFYLPHKQNQFSNLYLHPVWKYSDGIFYGSANISITAHSPWQQGKGR